MLPRQTCFCKNLKLARLHQNIISMALSTRHTITVNMVFSEKLKWRWMNACQVAAIFQQYVLSIIFLLICLLFSICSMHFPISRVEFEHCIPSTCPAILHSDLFIWSTYIFYHPLSSIPCILLLSTSFAHLLISAVHLNFNTWNYILLSFCHFCKHLDFLRPYTPQSWEPWSWLTDHGY